MNRSTIYTFFTSLALVGAVLPASAQKDTTRKQTIDITSSYKPVLRNPVKINFSASQLNADTSKSVAPYNVPPQNLFYTYQPVSLRPLALQQDTNLNLGIRNYLKVGFGNYSTPYVAGGFSFGDGKKSLVNVYGDYISSRGSLKNQDYNGINLRVAGSYFTGSNELYGSASFKQQDYYLYGYDHAAYTFNKADILQRFQALNLKAGFRNSAVTGSGINYDPNVSVTIFNNRDTANESTLVVNAPVEKTIADAFTIKVAAQADLTSYTSKAFTAPIKSTNNIFSIAPELIYAKPLYNIHVGVTPTWNNGKMSVLPNIYGEAKVKDKIFLAQAGVVGRFIKNNYQYLTGVNPFLRSLAAQVNTKETEIYGGIKATLGNHFNFSAKASWITYHNLPFFVNDTTDGKSFSVVNETRVNDLRLHGDLSYVNQDKFTITAGLTFNGYNGMQVNDCAWGTIPLEINGSLRWWAFKQVLLKADIMAFNGGAFLLKNGTDLKLGGGADMSAGLEFKINKNFSAWLDVNNIFNNKYQRWNQYPVYGFNLLAGATFRF